VEFIHTATLLHDDVVDESELRRGKAAAHVIWGNSPSVLVGDFLFSRSFQLMVETGSLRVLAILSNASAVIAEGEVMQLSSKGNIGISEETYLKIISAKTAALFAAASESGAVIAQADELREMALKSYGQNLGIAFQLVDDALDYSGREAMMGKAVGDDFREGKLTLPVIQALAKAMARPVPIPVRSASMIISSMPVLAMSQVIEADALARRPFLPLLAFAASTSAEMASLPLSSQSTR
jgi:octaprenyl-diphosphate synthase